MITKYYKGILSNHKLHSAILSIYEYKKYRYFRISNQLNGDNYNSDIFIIV